MRGELVSTAGKFYFLVTILGLRCSRDQMRHEFAPEGEIHFSCRAKPGKSSGQVRWTFADEAGGGGHWRPVGPVLGYRSDHRTRCAGADIAVALAVLHRALFAEPLPNCAWALSAFQPRRLSRG